MMPEFPTPHAPPAATPKRPPAVVDLAVAGIDDTAKDLLLAYWNRRLLEGRDEDWT